MKEVDVKNQTQRIMTIKWIISILVQYEVIVITSPSITGVTYMDHFDFEERYRDANECNPFYWHPLHLPAYCVEVFEKLIRSKIASKTPVRIMRKKEKKKKQEKETRVIKKPQPSKPQFSIPQEKYSPEQKYNFPYPVYQMTSAEYESYIPQYSESIPYTPYNELLELLNEDIKKAGPSSPTVTVIPSLGPVALYNQAISKKSENFIRNMAETYVNAIKKKYDEYYAAFDSYPSEPHLYVYDSAKNKTEEEKKNKQAKNKKKKDKDNKNKVYRVKTKHGNVVTIIETKNLEMMKKDELNLSQF